ncbi:MAG: MarR family transcriptional regulator, partial [Acidimicrobiales bacterium]
MSDSRDDRGANLLGALSLALVDRMRDATEQAAGHGGGGPAALVSIQEFLSGGSMDDLHKALGLTPSGAVRLVDRLAADGYVERRSGANGRSLALALTPKGRRAAGRVRAARGGAIDGVLDTLSRPDREALVRITEKLVRAVTADRLALRRGGGDPGGWLCRLCHFDACGRG